MRLNLDEYAYLDSPIHHWDARTKLLGLMAVIFSFAFVRTLTLVPAMLGVTALVYGLSRLPLSFLLARLRYPGYFILGVVLVLPFLSGSTVLWQLGFLSLRQEGLLAMLLIIGRFLSIITLGLVLFGTTPFLSLVRAMRSLGLPSILADMLLLTYRYLFVLLETLTTMQRSMRLRGFHHHSPRDRWFQPDWKHLQRFASLMGTLFIRSYEQSDRIYTAMRLRGYGSTPNRVPYRPSLAVEAGTRWHRVGLAIALLTAISFVIAEAWA